MALGLRHRHPVKLYFFLNTDPACTIQHTHKQQSTYAYIIYFLVTELQPFSFLLFGLTHKPKLKVLVELQ